MLEHPPFLGQITQITPGEITQITQISGPAWEEDFTRKAANLREGTRWDSKRAQHPRKDRTPQAHSTFTAMICPLGMCRIFSTTPYAPRPSSEMGSRSSAFTSKFWGRKAQSGPWVFGVCSPELAHPPSHPAEEVQTPQRGTHRGHTHLLPWPKPFEVRYGTELNCPASQRAAGGSATTTALRGCVLWDCVIKSQAQHGEGWKDKQGKKSN